MEHFYHSLIQISNKSVAENREQLRRLNVLLEKTGKTFAVGQNPAQAALRLKELSQKVKGSLEAAHIKNYLSNRTGLVQLLPKLSDVIIMTACTIFARATREGALIHGQISF